MTEPIEISDSKILGQNMNCVPSLDRVPELSVTIVGTQGHVQGQDSGTRLCRVPELGVERYTIFLRYDIAV